MSIKLLPASVNPIDPPDVSTSLVPLTPRALATRAGPISIVPSADAFAWSSSSTRQRGANNIDATPVEDSQSDATTGSGWESLSGWAWSHSVELTAVAHYLFYAATPASWKGLLIDVYA
jgi:hypothetical protein